MLEILKEPLPRLESFDDERSDEVKEFVIRKVADDEMRGSISLEIDVLEFMTDPQIYPEVSNTKHSTTALKSQY